ncbi:hybrid sensor histidine kinase/response regulator [Pseudoluteimonas lycopersici]|uniref:histidine kinase n=1 Tax=Pseudoluteimonas lycopersici TaxID=1324796 RepID=A0A516V8I4_9GAMM|nr:PAS domain-containing hybrid sensor histidine kinase/response regulator [Lysobacter lycopersici]QDQ74826.1 hybrid sensor histidine kinase/response regulator [Lysobacter lycopersici]
MIPGWVLLLVSAAYVCLLFTVAYAGDQRAPAGSRLRPLVYALALAVYCSSWTFYGAVGTAARDGLAFLPIYLGPLLLLLFGWRMLERLVLISGEQRIVSIADFLSSRYGRAPGLAALVAAVAVIAAIPYIALQFKAVAMSVDVLAPGRGGGAFGDPALYVAALLALFAILFGTRQIDATEHHRGMMLAVALESLVKLLAFLAIGLFAMLHLPGSGGMADRVLQAAATVGAQGMPPSFVAQTLIAFTAIICLPRQFHVAVVECRDTRDLRPARWLFGGYLVLVSLFVLPITLAGSHLLAADGVSPDAYVLALPLALDRESLALFAYIGGFSAATGMVIVSCVALATMVSNDIVMPLLLRSGTLRHDDAIDRRVLWVRRATIAGIAMLAYVYHRGAVGSDSLAKHGLLAFAAVAQFAPALIGGLYWRGASRAGAFAGLLAGALLWAYTLLLPELARGGWFGTHWIDAGPFGIEALRPQRLFGMQGWDALTHGVFWSLLINVGTFVFVSMRYRPRLQDQLLASPFLDPYAQRQPLGPGAAWNVRAGELLALAERILGERHAQRAFAEHARQSGSAPAMDAPADRALLQFTERLLASAIGAASARLTLTSALRGSGMELGEVVSLLDETTHALRFNREVMTTTIENMPQGVSVVDADMRLVAWNARYQQLFDYPDGMLYVGRPVADLLRWNAERGEMGPGDIEAQVERRLEHLRAGTPHVFERVRANGQVIELLGRALPGGGYVTNYSDITDYKRVERELREINETLEQRVELRTREAESAQQSKTRFLAAISHDVLQPLHAARLFASALREQDDAAEQARLAARVDSSLRAAEELLDGLLDVSRLDAGVLRPQLSGFDAAELLHELHAQYAPSAAQRGLELRVHVPATLPVRSDRRLLRRALQNFIGNALRYTQHGGVLLAARVRAGAVALEVVDTGPGIPAIHLRQIFEEFHRFEQPGERGERGLGLGLSICQRISNVLGHPLDVRSRVGRGSVFSISVPRASALSPTAPASQRAEPEAHDDALEGLRVLCVDNDPEILDGMRALLERWRAEVLCASTVEAALTLAARRPDVMLVDYHLHDRLDGLDALDALRAACGDGVVGALLTADGSDALKHATRERGYRLLTKPVKPASLRAFLAAVRRYPSTTDGV